MFKKLLLFLIIFFNSLLSYSQAEHLIAAKNALNRGDIYEARKEINKINPPYTKMVEDLRREIAAAEKKQRDKANALEAEKESRQYYENYCNDAEAEYEAGRYEKALRHIDNAMDLGVSDKIRAKGLKNQIQSALSDQFVVNAEKALGENDYYKARELFREAQKIKRSDYIERELNKLSTKINSHESLVKLAESEFRKGNYQESIDRLLAADDVIKLNKVGLELKRNASLKINLKNGEKFFNDGNWKDAAVAYELARSFALEKVDLDIILKRINLSNYNSKLVKANSAFNNGNFANTIQLLDEAKKYGELGQNDLDLYQKAKIAHDDQVWIDIENKNDDVLYQDYLNLFPAGRHSNDAKDKLISSLVANGDIALKDHNYKIAEEKYKKALLINPNDAALLKKSNKLNRWKNGLAGGLTCDFSIPLGYTKTMIETEDYYSYLYQLSNGNDFVEADYGVQKIYEKSLITPLQLGLEYSYPIRIKGFQPMNLNLGIKGVSNKSSNLSQVEPISYSIYEVGDIYPASSATVSSGDTLSNYFTNAYKFSQFQFKIGIQPFSFIEIYFPINRMSFQFQNDYNCLECATDDIIVGKKTKVGLGFKGSYTLNLAGIQWFVGGYYENWNTSFNSRASNNALVDSSKNAMGGFISLNPYSRSVGLNLGFKITKDFDMFINYTNNRIRGDFRTTLDPNVAFRGFYQHILSISFKYHIYVQ